MLNNIIGALKNVKHTLRYGFKNVPREIEDQVYKIVSSYKKYEYNPSRYFQYVGGVRVTKSTTFQTNHLIYKTDTLFGEVKNAPKKLFLLWTGGNEITEARKKNIDKIFEEQSGLEVVLVTPYNLHEYIVDGYPLHKSYKYLSYIHRSDYLRAYLMHHHGGVYTDIKNVHGYLSQAVDSLNADDNLWVYGAHETAAWNVTPPPGPLGKDQKMYYTNVINQSLMICKPYSPFTYEWMGEVNRRMDYYASLLHAESADQPFGLNEEYPVQWNALLGQVFTPLCMKYMQYIKTDSNLYFDLSESHR